MIVSPLPGTGRGGSCPGPTGGSSFQRGQAGQGPRVLYEKKGLYIRPEGDPGIVFSGQKIQGHIGLLIFGRKMPFSQGHFLRPGFDFCRKSDTFMIFAENVYSWRKKAASQRLR